MNLSVTSHAGWTIRKAPFRPCRMTRFHDHVLITALPGGGCGGNSGTTSAVTVFDTWVVLVIVGPLEPLPEPSSLVLVDLSVMVVMCAVAFITSAPVEATARNDQWPFSSGLIPARS